MGTARIIVDADDAGRRSRYETIGECFLQCSDVSQQFGVSRRHIAELRYGLNGFELTYCFMPPERTV